MIVDPHEDVIPGLGCGCARCKAPLIEVRPLTPEESLVRHARYAATRQGVRQELGTDHLAGRYPGKHQTEDAETTE